MALSRLCAAPWRVDQHWWRADVIRRTYWRVVTTDGLVLTIHLDGVTGTWHRQQYNEAAAPPQAKRFPAPKQRDWRNPARR
jgi:hypothetical protein